jgi:fatty-acyl-CoA synthase
MPHALDVPATTLCANLDAAAAAAPGRAAIVFGEQVVSYRELQRQASRIAGWLQQRCGVRAGDRVLLFSQNCPQFTAAFYGVLRADAVVVPVNAMSTADELAYLAADSGAQVLLVASELVARALPLLHDGRLRHALVHRYAEAAVPPGLPTWDDALAAALQPAPASAGPDDLCLLPYTSGTTGRAKGCRHSHRTLMHSICASRQWRGLAAGTVVLSVAPMFHLLGMQNGMNLPILLAGTVVMLSRWDRAAAADAIERHRVQFWAGTPAMVVDFFAQPGLAQRDLSSLQLLVGGGAAMPDAVSALLKDRYGIGFNEAYGLTETASFLHCNPVGREKRCCLGVPTFGVDSRIVDPLTLAELPAGETGELVTHAPQLMQGYWNRPEADAESFFERDGRRYFRTGDLCSVDDEGYFFMRDRLKRMINASGYKVWPAEVENLLYAHPAVYEACVIGTPDVRGGEAVKALVVLKPDAPADLDEAAFIAWCRTQMAVYKAPRQVAFVDALPKSGTGKILWRELQDRERAGG